MASSPDGRPGVPRARALLFAAGCLLVTALLGLGVLADLRVQAGIDGAVSEALYAGDGRARLLDDLLELLTLPGTSAVRWVLFAPVVVWLAVRRDWLAALWVSVAVVVIWPLTDLLKDLFGRVRPDFDLGGARYESLSYPSGHSSGIATLVAVALVLAWPVLRPAVRRRWLAAGVVVVVLVGLTRMWLGVHYLSDVLGGWALGTGWTLCVAAALGGLPGGPGALRSPVREEAR